MKEVAVDKPRVHILQWFHMARHSEVLACIWLRNVERLELVKLVNKRDHQRWISKVPSACQSNSFVGIGLLGDSLVWPLLSPQPRPLVWVRIFYALRSGTNSKEFDIIDHIRLQMVPFSNWPNSCCYKKTQLKPSICPNFCHNEWHTLEACLPEFDSPFWFARQFVDDKLSFELIWFREPLVVAPKTLPQTEYHD